MCMYIKSFVKDAIKKNTIQDGVKKKRRRSVLFSKRWGKWLWFGVGVGGGRRVWCVHAAFREEKEAVLIELLCGSDVGTVWGRGC